MVTAKRSACYARVSVMCYYQRNHNNGKSENQEWHQNGRKHKLAARLPRGSQFQEILFRHQENKTSGEHSSMFSTSTNENSWISMMVNRTAGRSSSFFS